MRDTALANSRQRLFYYAADNSPVQTGESQLSYIFNFGALAGASIFDIGVTLHVSPVLQLERYRYAWGFPGSDVRQCIGYQDNNAQTLHTSETAGRPEHIFFEGYRDQGHRRDLISPRFMHAPGCLSESHQSGGFHSELELRLMAPELTPNVQSFLAMTNPSQKSVLLVLALECEVRDNGRLSLSGGIRQLGGSRPSPYNNSTTGLLRTVQCKYVVGHCMAYALQCAGYPNHPSILPLSRTTNHNAFTLRPTRKGNLAQLQVKSGPDEKKPAVSPNLGEQ